MKIREVTEEKKQYLDLLLLADEQESMLDRYLADGTMYVLEENGVQAECVVLEVETGVLEIKNLAVSPSAQRKGFGKAMLAFLEERYRGVYRVLQVGTGESPATLPFYEKCGFVPTHRIPDFFRIHYDHPIFDGGVLLQDMVYLQKKL